MIPRNTLQGTRAEHLLRRDFFSLYLHARLLDGDDRTVPDASLVFRPEALPELRARLSEEALNTPVVLTDRLSNRVLGVHLLATDAARIVAINARFQVDPDMLAHTLLEEFAHTQQVLDGTDFEAQQRDFGYAQRPYEQKAKQLATDIMGYDPISYEVYLLRDEPPGPLYNRKGQDPPQGSETGAEP